MSQFQVSPSQIFQLLSQKRCSELKTVLSQAPHLNFFHISDPKGYTVLHHAALTRQFDAMTLFIEYMRKSNAFTQDLFKAWINRESLDEGFTALHLACYKGNIEVAQHLLTNGAEIESKTFQGFTSLHIAAQADQIAAIVLLKSKGCQLNAVDCKGSTALHWAAYTGCEQAINYLTRWGEVELNLRDLDQGYTPLHLATITGNSKIVRRLIIKGGDMGIRDNLGKVPADLAKDNHFNNILRMLKSPCKGTECYKITPAFHHRKSRAPFFTFWGLFLTVSIVLFLIDFPALLLTVWNILQLTLTVPTLFFFLLSWLKSPGFINQGHEKELLQLICENSPGEICPDCAIVKRSRARHCDSCGRCVEIFDHHCPWIANCVGVRNHRDFLLFLLFQWSLMLFALAKCGFFLINPLEDEDILWIKLFGSDSSASNLIRIIVQCALMLTLFLFLIPTSVLMFVQIGNFMLNRTTAERFGYNANTKRTEKVGNFEEIQEKLDIRNESAETIPSLASSKGFLGKNKHPKGLQRYLFNCMDMCYRNERNLG